MIYLIDDKKYRQNDFGWNEELLKKDSDVLKPIYHYSQISDDYERKEIFKSGNIILFHESFFENAENKHHADKNEIRNNLLKFAENNPDFQYVSFSGSNNTRQLLNNVASLPVETLYTNLQEFICVFKNTGVYDLRVLLYGENYKIEEAIISELEIKKTIFSNELTNSLKGENTIFLRSRDDLQSPFSSATPSYTIFNKDVEDINLHQKVKKWFGSNSYDKIFIPLCFGQSKSDFNGLRLGCHIRCTKTINQLKPIFIYSPIDISYFYENEFFNILKTQNVFLIDYSQKAFAESIETVTSQLTGELLPYEISKLKLDPPKSYFDNHSIANEWGIFQLSRNANLDINEIIGFDNEKLNTIYFKWLITKNQLDKPLASEQIQNQRRYAQELQGVKVLGKIDLSKFKK